MKRPLFFLLVLTNIAASAQDPVLLTINDSIKVTRGEFERTYKKNNDISINSGVKGKDDYLQLFINYKLKVQEAIAMKLDTAGKFREEYNGYVKQLTEPYLVDTTIDNKVVMEIYDRLKYQVRTSHILVKVGLDAAPKDTLVAYKKALALRNRVLKGEPFDSVARQESDDPSAKQNNGDIGYQTVLNVVYEYENAMYTTPVGQVSMPTRTQFGYHIIKVTDKKPANGQFRMAHVLVMPNSKDSLQLAKAKLKIDSAYNDLQNGTPFGKVAARYSEDKRTKDNGGIFPGWIGSKQRFPKLFKDIAYETNVGEYSKPFQSEFGWHIINILDKRVSASFEEELPGIKDRIKHDAARKMKGRDAIIARLRSEYKYQENKKIIDAFISKIDTSILTGHWKMKGDFSDKRVLCTFANVSCNELDFANWIVGYETPLGKTISDSKSFVIEKLLKIYVDQRIIEYETSMLGIKYPEYRYLTQEYHDGMLLFDLTDKMIWSRTGSDEQGLTAFHKDNASKYMWGDRAEVCTFKCEDPKTADKLLGLLRNKEKSKQTDEEILKEINKKDTLVKTEVKLHEKGDATITKLGWTPGSTVRDSETTILEVRSIKTPEQKPLTECRGQVISDFQKQLEDQWISSLRMKYKVEVNKDVFNTIQD